MQLMLQLVLKTHAEQNMHACLMYAAGHQVLAAGTLEGYWEMSAANRLGRGFCGSAMFLVWPLGSC